MNLYVALLHYPVYSRAGKVVTTSVANMDIHDIARAARTYGVRKFYIVTPLGEQRKLVGRILEHWKTGYGAEFNPARKEAFDLVEISSDLEATVKNIEENGGKPKLVATGAGFTGDVITHEALREIMDSDDKSYLLVFGTGSGLAGTVIERADYRLEPIKGPGGYNHLSVRSAVAITLDRIINKSF